MISDPGSTRGSSSRRVKASILPSPICSRVANRLEGEHCEMWDAPPAPPAPPTGSTTHQRDPRPHLQKSRTQTISYCPAATRVVTTVLPGTAAAHPAAASRTTSMASSSVKPSLSMRCGTVSYTHLRAHETDSYL